MVSIVVMMREQSKCFVDALEENKLCSSTVRLNYVSECPGHFSFSWFLASARFASTRVENNYTLKSPTS